MARAEFFYNANIPFAVAWSTSFKQVINMMLKLNRSYLFPSYHDIHKTLFNDTKNKIKVQIVE
jgi:hypothetical protein